MVVVHVWWWYICGGEKHPRMEKLFQVEKMTQARHNVTSG
jgi:hypothetical protein